jgi:O-antigen ligase
MSNRNSLRRPDWGRVWASVRIAAWVALFLFLPVTSFPFFPPAFGGGVLVRPLSVYPLIILLVIAVIPGLWKDRLPRQFLALGIFVLVVLASGAISLLQDVDSLQDISSPERMMRTMITLGLGLAFYLAVSLTPRSQDELRSGLKALYVGFGIALVWGLFQLVNVIHFNHEYFVWLNRIQEFISIRKLIDNRISGMTYEPNWFSAQLTGILIPWLLAAVFTTTTVFKSSLVKRWRWLTVELVMLICAVMVLPFTFSRAGLLNLGALAVISLFLYKMLHIRLRPGSPASNLNQGTLRRPWVRGLRLAVELTVILGMVAAMFYIASTRNIFFSRLWDYWKRPHATFRGYIHFIGFDARLIYSETAFNIYQVSPWVGIGPGNYALYFKDQLPYRALAKTPEVVRMITPEDGRDRLITSKNFFLRLLAETGILGTAAFVAFLISIIGSIIYLWLSPHREEKFWGIGGVLAFVVFLLSTLSFDSFAVPNMWIVLGLITAADRLAREKNALALEGNN